MPQNEEILRRTQAGKETVRGTAATIDRKLYEVIRLMDAREPLQFAENAGSRYGHLRTFAQGPVSVAGTVAGPVAFEDFGWWLGLGVDGAVAPTNDAGTPVAAATGLWLPAEAVDGLDSATMEHGAPDNVYRSRMVMLPSFTVRGDVDGDAAWMLDGALIARDKEPLAAGFTAAIPDRERTYVRAAGTRLFIDDDPANIGTTQVLERFINFSVTYDNALAPKRFMEDVDAISTRVGGGQVAVTGQVRLEFDDDSEYANYRNGAPRAIRIEREGPIIHAAVTMRARIDIPRAYWGTPSDDPRENNMTLTFPFIAYMEDTEVGAPISFEVVAPAAA